MRRIAGIVIFFVGVLLLVGSLRFGVPPGKGLGILGMFVGAAVFGLSFIPRPQPGPNAPAPLSPVERVSRVFYEPEPVFENLKHYPRWLAGFLVMVFFAATYQVAVMQRLGPERIADDYAGRIIEGGLLQPDKSPDDFRQQAIRGAIATAASDRITTFPTVAGQFFILLCVMAGLYMLCVMAFGGRINFWQSLSVATYGFLPQIVVPTILSLVLLYIQSPDDIIPLRAQQRGLARADLGLLFSPSERPYLYTLMSFVGLFNLYGWWLTVVGLKKTSEKLSGGSAWAIALILWLFGALITTLLIMLAPTFAA